MRALPIIETCDLQVCLGGEYVLKDINIKIAAGEMIGVIGPNGAGKTTFLRVLLGLVKPTAGQVKIFGQSPAALGKIRDKIGYMPQHLHYERHFPLSVRDVVLMGAVSSTMLGRVFSRLQREEARQCLSRVGLAELQDKPLAELSGGQQQRVFLARALIKKPHLLLLDEPNAGLDLPSQSRFFNLLQELQRRLGLTVVVVAHDLTLIARYAQKLICINRTMHIHGTPAEVLRSPNLEKAYRCEFDLLFGNKRGGRD